MRIGIGVKGVGKCKYNVGRKIVVVKEKFVLLGPKKKEWNDDCVKEKKIEKEEQERSMKKKYCNKTWSTTNQYEISLGECLVSLKKIMCMSEYGEM